MKKGELEKKIREKTEAIGHARQETMDRVKEDRRRGDGRLSQDTIKLINENRRNATELGKLMSSYKEDKNKKK